MPATTLTTSRHQTVAAPHPRPLLSVMAWELRRVRASRLVLFQALGLWGFLLLIIWALHASHQLGTVSGTQQLSAFVAGTSVGGLLHTLPTDLLILALLLPFMTADGVARDAYRRTHELLMTTALPTWAYVLGRYLAGLIIGLGMALLLFASILGVGGLLHLADSTYPLPQPNAVLLLWLGMVVPATILVSSVGFAVSTVFPRLSTLVKVVLLVAWMVGALVIPLGLGDTTTPPTWYVNWDPTSAITARGLLPAYAIQLGPSIGSEAQLQQLILTVENKLPDVAGWFAPHLIEAGLSVLLVVMAAFAFKRFRNVFGA